MRILYIIFELVNGAGARAAASRGTVGGGEATGRYVNSEPRRRGRAAPEPVCITVPDASARKRGRQKGSRKDSKRRKARTRSSSSEEEPPGKKGRGAARRRKRAEQSSSSSSSDSSSSSSRASESDSERSEAGSSSSAGKGGKKKKEKESATWALLNDIWPVEERPKKLQDRRYVGKLSWPTLMALQDRYEKEAEKKGVGSAIYGRDRKLRKIRFKEKADDGYAKLHRARWLRLPMAAPEKYWRKVPRTHEQKFRHLQLAHYGAESQINERVILSLHDRQVGAEFSLF